MNSDTKIKSLHKNRVSMKNDSRIIYTLQDSDQMSSEELIESIRERIHSIITGNKKALVKSVDTSHRVSSGKATIINEINNKLLNTI
jgi:hypothetical protein